MRTTSEIAGHRGDADPTWTDIHERDFEIARLTERLSQIDRAILILDKVAACGESPADLGSMSPLSKARYLKGVLGDIVRARRFVSMLRANFYPDTMIAANAQITPRAVGHFREMIGTDLPAIYLALGRNTAPLERT